MNIHLIVPEATHIWLWNIENLLRNSLIDCGHIISNLELADIIIAIQYYPKPIKKEIGKYYILLQTEQPDRIDYSQRPDLSNSSDVIWDFVIGNNYLCLGYHPCLELNEDVKKMVDIGFLGCSTPRRDDFFKSVKNKPLYISSWDYNIKRRNIKKSRINLNIHSYKATSFTEWDRLCVILANKSFLLSEIFYCPLSIIQFEGKDDYDTKVDYYLNHEQEREDIAVALYEQYKKDFDMRNILTEKLSNRNKYV